jgi:hypothetical protein
LLITTAPYDEKETKESEISGSYGSEYEEVCLVGCCTM